MISAERVESIFADCFFKDGEDSSSYVEARGVTFTAGFQPGRLKEHEAEIVAMLEELPNRFRASGGGGWSFLNACNDRHGNQWGEHQDVERLFMLGIATGKAKCQMPKEMWASLPGGMPYYVIYVGEAEDADDGSIAVQ